MVVFCLANCEKQVREVVLLYLISIEAPRNSVSKCSGCVEFKFNDKPLGNKNDSEQTDDPFTSKVINLDNKFVLISISN